MANEPQGRITLLKDGVSFVVPVNPPEIRIQRPRTYNEVPILGYRDIGRFGNMGLKELTITDTYFPVAYDPMLHNYPNLMSPFDSKKLLATWAEDPVGAPVWVTITTPALEALWMAIVQFDTWEQAGEPGDIYYHLHLREYVHVDVQVFDVGQVVAPT